MGRIRIRAGSNGLAASLRWFGYHLGKENRDHCRSDFLYCRERYLRSRSKYEYVDCWTKSVPLLV
jgi:hypothetical protein